MAQTPNIESGFADINGAQLYYEVAGAGHPLVLIHAGIADRRMWDDQFALFAQQFRVLRYDLAGFGKSQPASGSFSHSADLYELLQQRGIDRAHLIGVSIGGSTILDFAIQHPDMVTSLISVCGGISGFQYEGENPPGWNAILAEDAAIDALIDAGNKDEAMPRAAELDARIWVDGVYRTPDQVDRRVRDRVREMTVGTFAYLDVPREQQPLDPPAIERLETITVPTLVIVGELDLPEVRAASDVMAERIPNARKIVMPNTAHVPPMEHPDEFNRIVSEFLASV